MFTREIDRRVLRVSSFVNPIWVRCGRSWDSRVDKGNIVSYSLNISFLIFLAGDGLDPLSSEGEFNEVKGSPPAMLA